VTVFSVELVAEAETLPWDAYKTASPDLINKPLLDALAATRKPLIVSTGASTMEEVSRTVDWLRDARQRLALLQCVSAYPVPQGSEALPGIAALAGVFEGPVGYSDHTDDMKTGFAAYRWGACLLEKHLTYDSRAPGPDHSASLGPAEFRLYSGFARFRPGDVRRYSEPHASDADGARVNKEVQPVEQDVRRVSRQSLVTRRGLRPDHRIARDDLTIKRPGTGIEPWRLDEVVGRQTARAVEADVPLVEDDLA
jgi:N-acetylneuraminate synthase/N,N'-diacetyllegionaminate synthase